MLNKSAVKTPNKRKSVGNAAPGAATSPKQLKPNETPGKNQNNKTPAKGQTPKITKTPAKTPQGPKPNATPGKGPKPTATPKGPKPANATPGIAKKAPQQNTIRVKKDGEKGGKRKGDFFNIVEKIKGANEGELKAVATDIEEKIQSINNRKDISKTAKRKLRLLQKLKFMATHGGKAPAIVDLPSKAQKNREQKKGKKATTNGGAPATKKPQQKQGKKGPKPPKAAEVEEEEAEDDSSESDYEVEGTIKPDRIIKTADEDDDDDESDDVDDDDDDDDEEESEEEETKPQKGKKPQQKGKGVNLTDLKKTEIVSQGQKRYVLFVGNLPYDVSKKEIVDHFQKVGPIRDVRIPNEKKTDRPRGFAYVEVEDEVSYQKALSMHHTFINKRRINVLYSQGGKKKGEQKKGEIKAKNFKLHAMRQQGQLAGSVKTEQKRGARRAKAANAKKGAVNGS